MDGKLHPIFEITNQGKGGLREDPRNTFWSESSPPSISKDVLDSGTDISRTSTAEAMEAEDSATVSLIGLIIKQGNIRISRQQFIMYRYLLGRFLFNLIQAINLRYFFLFLNYILVILVNFCLVMIITGQRDVKAIQNEFNCLFIYFQAVRSVCSCGQP